MVTAILSGINLGAAGLNAALTFAGGLASGVSAVAASAQALAARVAAQLVGQSPPPEGPLHHIDMAGMALVETWLRPMDAKGPARVSKTAGRLAGALTMGGHVGAAAVASRGGGDTYQIGTLVATEGGLDQLEHRMSRRKRRRSRVRRLYNDVD